MAAVCALVLSTAVAVPAGAEVPFLFWFTVSPQQPFPKQTNTNEQIEPIKEIFGVDFDTWDDVVNLSVGGTSFTQVSPSWLVGVEVDFSRGGIEGSATVVTEAGPAALEFEQAYSIDTDLLAVAHFLPCPKCTSVTPFVLLGGGIGCEEDAATLTLRNDDLDEDLKVENDGFFPVWTVGVGCDIVLNPASAPGT